MQRFLMMYILVPLSLLIVTACAPSSHNTSTFILYEDAEEGLNPQWIVMRGESTPSRIEAYNGSQYCVNLPVSWEKNDQGKWYNPHEYHLPLNNNQGTILEVDVGGTGQEIPHYVLGVIIDTTYGKRTILWDSWYNHENLDAHFTENANGDASIVFPSPVELVRGYGYESTTKWSHFEVDIEDYLQQFEPHNHLIQIKTFIATGGNLDNIGVSSR